ncbi:hypothetical protein pEaSNUABM8_00182 [Erwinia phage pEa_SNUABM_8]|nr:hypothetical protein pEaSNUABM8_00182 [Erwinia phage pEa_SNUABM_8]
MAKNALEQFLALYNTNNPSLPQPLTLADAEILDPNAYEGGGKNTMVEIHALPESTVFTGMIEVHYTRLDTGLSNETVEGSPDDWRDDAFVTAALNTRLQANFPDDMFMQGELNIGRNDELNGSLSVIVNWPRSFKFLPPQGPNGVVKFTISSKTQLAGTDGELNGFS